MRIGIVFLMTLSFIGGCATRSPASASAPPTPAKPYYTEDVLVVAEDDAIKFWMVDDPSSILAKGDRPGNGCFRMQVIIDSNGNLFDPKPLAVVGSPEFYKWVPQLLAKLHYRPTTSNTNKTPIKTTIQWTFSTTVGTGETAPSSSRIKQISEEGPPPEAQKFMATCKMEMDKQMQQPEVKAPAPPSPPRM